MARATQSVEVEGCWTTSARRGWRGVLVLALLLAACTPDDQPVVGYSNPLSDTQGGDLAVGDSVQDGVSDGGPSQVTTCLANDDCPKGMQCDAAAKYCFAAPCEAGTPICVGPYAAVCGPDGKSAEKLQPCPKGGACQAGACTGSSCGDGVCSAGSEDCGTCAKDCGPCVSVCGDGVCGGGENCQACQVDCGPCGSDQGCKVSDLGGCGGCACETCVCKIDPACCTNQWDNHCVDLCSKCGGGCGAAVCSDGVCDAKAGENCSSCEIDCGPCQTKCGDGICQLATGESCKSCASDCGLCPGLCGNGSCEGDAQESCSTCAVDCGKCPPKCGNLVCEAGEGPASCPSDCKKTDCGNGACEANETCVGCPSDCGKCGSGCGDGKCDANQGEDCFGCSQDCGKCTETCGNQVCDAKESCSSCPLDCGECVVKCGDGVCAFQAGESCDTCPGDCPCQQGCGNKVCSPAEGESCLTCAADCGACPKPCGNGVCSDDESCASCPADCGPCKPYCGNKICDANENCSSCAADCGPCKPGCGNKICEPGESCSACPGDCGPCPFGCGDGKCGIGPDGVPESCQSCPKDCGPCKPGSCVGKCGGASDGCYCDQACTQAGDCCADFAAVCPSIGCGDGVCTPSKGETCQTCPIDCGGCPSLCGNGACEPGEDCNGCPKDCGACSKCGNGTCEPKLGEDCKSCANDCGSCPAICGNGNCEAGESCKLCPKDCGACPTCGDMFCAAGESCETCPKDCGLCAPTCGNGQCGAGETCSNCPKDCGGCSVCGDKVCDAAKGESCKTCSLDCGACSDGCKEGPAGCDGCACQKCVCGKDPFCCQSAWDQLCVSECVECGQNCPGVSLCGNGVCNPGESCTSCPNDCGNCGPVCGDAKCDAAGGETCTSCSADCGPCKFGCGDGICGLSENGNLETCGSCPIDCGPCPVVCGNGKCELATPFNPGETCSSCPKDCGPCKPVCGDKLCDKAQGETCSTCTADCGPCPAVCGNAKCEAGETCLLCPKDCGTCPVNDGCSAWKLPTCNGCACEKCVCEKDPFCCQVAWGPECVDLCKGGCGGCGSTCVPKCEGKQCGDNGCGGACGLCPVGSVCTFTGVCVVQPKTCGDGVCKPSDGESCKVCPQDCGACPAVCGDGACVPGESCSSCPKDCGVCPATCGNGSCEPGESCSTCAKDCCPPAKCGDLVCQASAGESCSSCAVDCGACPCQPKCDGKQCGSDGCSGQCGTCKVGEFCTTQGACQCAPQCAGKQCGPDGCGGQCGTCGTGTLCVGSQCVNPQKCLTDAECADSDPCTLDYCLKGLCGHDPSQSPACCKDPDGDGACTGKDNCPDVANADQLDSDADGSGDACDLCPTVPSQGNADQDKDGLGDSCDNCPLVQNKGQENLDGDAQGDACDPDMDGDGFANAQDCAPKDPAVPALIDTPCNGQDENCNGSIDEGGVAVWQFDDGNNAGWSFDPSVGGVGWQVWQGGESKTPKGALWFGNPKTGNFNGGNQAVKGAARSPVIALPTGKVTLTAWQLLHIEGGSGFDKLSLEVATESGGFSNWTVLKNKDDSTPIGKWHQLLVDLSAYQGQRVRLRWMFDSIDAVANDTSGVWIDSVAIGSTATKVPDSDGDGSGDACDSDDDGDGIPDAKDNCSLVKDGGALSPDSDGDGLGNSCDPDDDDDGVIDLKDNCPANANKDQKDSDFDGIGDVCDPTPNGGPKKLPFGEKFDSYQQSFGEGGWSSSTDPGMSAWSLQASADGNKYAQLVMAPASSGALTTGRLVTPQLDVGAVQVLKLTAQASLQLPPVMPPVFPGPSATLAVQVSTDGKKWTTFQNLQLTGGAQNLSLLVGPLPAGGKIYLGFQVSFGKSSVGGVAVTLDNLQIAP